MLSALTIRHIALIENATLTLGQGLTVLTGETGAGKSMLMTALSLALGGRAESGHLRPGQSSGEVTATFQPAYTPELTELLTEQGLTPEADGTLILRRQLTLADNGSLTSRAWLNGTPIPLSILSQIAEHLVEHHGQHAHTRLLSPATQRSLYDTLAGAQREAAATAQAHAAFKQAEAHLSDLQAKQAAAESRKEVLDAWLKELNDLDMQQAEKFADLLAQRQKLAGMGQLSQTLQTIDDHLGQAVSHLRSGSLALDKTLTTAPELEASAQTLTNLLSNLEDAAHDLARQTSQWDEPEMSLEALDDILHALKSAARKHHTQPEDLPRIYEELSTESTQLGNLSQDIKEAQTALATAQAKLTEAAVALTAKRTKFVPTFQKALTPLLTALNLPKATLLPHLAPTAPTAHGAEDLTFLFSANPGQPAQPLGKVASGGELSRLMLALKTVLYQKLSPKTLVLDEADTGLGGATASAVGSAMQNLAAHHQVLTITHHAQVAAHAHHHVKIEKSSTANATSTTLTELTAAAREAELARMLAGKTITPEARAAAATLLAENQGR